MTGGLVVVLGRVGRNFAAGMSGGVAYVLDLDPSLVNATMVGLGPLDQTDETELVELVRRHGEESESSVAAALLADWPEAMRRFTKVMPEDFKRVLAARAAAERDGLSDDAATELMMEAAHG
jgi:glutamate synthase (NADPH/NADH) large chain